MDTLKNQLVKAGIVSQEYVNQMEKAERQAKARGEELQRRIAKREEKEREAIDLLDLHLPFAGLRPTNLQGIMILGQIAKDIIKDYTKGEYRNHKCCMCKKEGTSRLETVRAHEDVLKEFGNFKFMIDDEEHKKFLQAFINKVGILLDGVRDTPFWICIPCKNMVIDKIQPHFRNYLKLVEPYIESEGMI